MDLAGTWKHYLAMIYSSPFKELAISLQWSVVQPGWGGVVRVRADDLLGKTALRKRLREKLGYVNSDASGPSSTHRLKHVHFGDIKHLHSA